MIRGVLDAGSPGKRRARAARTARALRRFALAVVACAPAGIAAAAAHDFCLLPSSPRSGADGSVELAMHVAETFPGELVAWRGEKVVDFQVIDAKGRADVAGPALSGDPARARLTLRSAGTTVIALTTSPSYIELEAGEFNAYLTHEQHATALQARKKSGRDAAPGRERYTRHVKTVVNATGPSASVALTRVGLDLEIVPETDLSRLKPGDHLPIRAFYKGDPYTDAPICATDDGWDGGPDTYAWCGRLDGAGRAEVPVRAAGWQMIRATRMIPIKDDPKADWHSYWSSLTFHVDAPQGEETKP
jgi:uncharacterized GH25 family protein